MLFEYIFDISLKEKNKILEEKIKRIELEELDKFYDEYNSQIPIYTKEIEEHILKDFTKVPYLNGNFNWGYLDDNGNLKYLSIYSPSKECGDLKYLLKFEENRIEMVGVRDITSEKVEKMSKRVLFKQKDYRIN